MPIILAIIRFDAHNISSEKWDYAGFLRAREQTAITDAEISAWSM
jgi:hypothetical protein